MDGGIFRKDVFVDFWMVLWMGFVDGVGFFLSLDDFLRSLHFLSNNIKLIQN